MGKELATFIALVASMVMNFVGFSTHKKKEMGVVWAISLFSTVAQVIWYYTTHFC